jgi:hypothetical protein
VNFRRGFLRIYLVLSAVFVCIVVVDEISWSAVNRLKEMPVREIVRDPQFFGLRTQQQLGILTNADPDFAQLSPEAKEKVLNEFTRRFRLGGANRSSWMSAVLYWVKFVAITLLYPIAGYGVLFHLVPWMGRGFQSK